MSRSTIPSKRSADAQEAAWVADEDRFVLQQTKKKAALRVKGGRAQPVDWLAVTLAVIDPTSNPLDDELDAADLDIADPEGVFEGLSHAQTEELEKGIDGYLVLEKSRGNREYWSTMKAICEERRRNATQSRPGARGVTSVASDLDKLLAPKSLEELEKLERQINTKLASNEPIDTDYWEHLLKSLLTYKAKAKLRKVSQSMLTARLDRLRRQQIDGAAAFEMGLRATVRGSQAEQKAGLDNSPDGRHSLDPNPMLRLRSDDKLLDSVSDEAYSQDLMLNRQKVLRRGFIPQQVRSHELDGEAPPAKRHRPDAETLGTSNTSLFDREVARGLGENEEIITTEEPVETKHLSQWSGQHRPRKPKYFNRLQLGYEWNKYNQTHYDHEHPPPRVVQGYKFNIFYPDLVDNTKAPTYRIQRENGRKRGQTFAPAGEDDTCVIRFTAGPPYEDVAFRIIDREWDFSTKRERGFKSSYDKGTLQLHFQFKKVYYRK